MKTAQSLLTDNFNSIWENASQIPSVHFPKEHGQLVYEVASCLQGIGVEVGSWAGRSSVILGKAFNFSKGHLFCVDHWNLIQEMEIDTPVDIWKFWNLTIQQFNLSLCVTPLRGISSEVASGWPKKEEIDLLFIDGYHEYREADKLTLSSELIEKFNIRGWKKNGMQIPLESFAPLFERGVKVDFDCWTPKLKKGGILIMHDINRLEHPGVNRVWKEEVQFSENWEVSYNGDGIGFAKKLA